MSSLGIRSRRPPQLASSADETVRVAREATPMMAGSDSVNNLYELASQSDMLRRLSVPLHPGTPSAAAASASASASAASASACAPAASSRATLPPAGAPFAAASRASSAASSGHDGCSTAGSGSSGGGIGGGGLPALFEASLPLIRQGAAACVDDSFTRCFKSQKRVPWNWNIYLAPAWLFGVFVRYCILFPLRAFALFIGFAIVCTGFPIVKVLGFAIDTTRLELFLIRVLASAFVTSWSGVVRIHGLRPTPRAGRPAGVFVANHSSMIDFIILLQSHPYAVVGQKHPGWVGLLQDHLLRKLQCLWFNRGQSKDRRAVADLISAHCRDAGNNDCPLLIFPEGTCVNNEYVVQFKKFVFELGVPVNPIAIKYNKVFVDAYWNSREQSFLQHLLRLMTSWAVVVDVWFLDQQLARPGERAEDFATRVQRMIAARAGIKAVDWDGYMKYWKPNARFLQERQRLVCDDICAGLGIAPTTAAASEGAAAEGAPSADAS